MGTHYIWHSPRLHPCSFIFILYINDLPKTIADLANPVLFAEDTSMIISKSDPKQFTKRVNRNIIIINKCLKVIHYH